MKKMVLLGLCLMFPLLLCFAGNTFHVSPSGTHVVPFNTLETASTNIQSAVDAALSGDVVMVQAGNYMLSTQIVVSAAIQIVGADGGTVVVDGGGVTRCFFLENVQCVINGLTITNGYVQGIPDDGVFEEGGGVYCLGNMPVLTNCVIVGCQADLGGGVARTTAYGCVISDNHAAFVGGGAESAVLHFCEVTKNEAEFEGGGIDFSEAHSCLIAGNTVLTANGSGGGGVSYDSKLYNCTVVDNFSFGDGGGVAGGENGTIIVNSIVVSNIALSAGMNFIGSISMANTCSPDANHEVDGNITNAPLFMDWGLRDFRLQASSPCKHTGNNAHVSFPLDLDGNTRIVGRSVDMGAYEFQGTPSDTDADDMLDAWEIQFFGDLDEFANADWDNDPFSNLEEYITGTDPTNPASFFAMTNRFAGGIVVEWLSVTNREYKVLWAENLTNSFVQLGPTFDYPQNSYTDTNHTAESRGFYKVEVQLK